MRSLFNWSRNRVHSVQVGAFLLVLPLFASGCGADDDNKEEVETDTYDALPECSGGVEDIATTLCWQAPIEKTAVSWEDAIAYCDALDLGGYDDWYLPSADEMRTIIRGCKSTAKGGACQVRSNVAASEWADGCKGCAALEGLPPNGCYANRELGACDKKYFYTTSSTGTGDISDPTRENIYIRFDTAGFGVAAETAYARCVRQVGAGK